MCLLTQQFIKLLGLGLALGLVLMLVIPVSGQSGSSDPDEEAVRHLELGRIFEQAGEWDKAIAEYELATVAKLPHIRQAALEGVKRAITGKSDPWLKLQRDVTDIAIWFLSRVVEIAIIASLGLLILLLLIRTSERQASLVIFPFIDLATQTQDMGVSIAETIADTLHQARLIHAGGQAREMLTISEEIDLPSFSSQRYTESLSATLGTLNALNVGGVGLPIGSVLESLFKWLSAGHPRIVGSLQRYGNTYHLTARLEEGRGHRCKYIWQESQEFLAEEAHRKLATLAKGLAFDILFGLDKNWGTKSPRSLEQFTLGLSEMQSQHEVTGNVGALRRAATCFEQAVVLDPAFAAAKYNHALACIGLGDYDKAISLLRSLRLHPHPDLEPATSYNLGVAYSHLGKDWTYDLAEKEFNNVIGSVGTSACAAGERNALLLALAHCGLAYVNAQRIYQDPANVALYFKMMMEHFQSSEFLHQTPDVGASAHTALGIAYLNMKDYSKAIEELLHVTELKSDYWRAYIYRGKAELEQAEVGKGSIDAAILSFEQAVAINPDFEYAQFQLGLALKKRGDKSKNDLAVAIQAFSRARRIAPAHDQLGRIYAQHKDFEKALSEFREALRINSRHSDALADLAWYTLVPVGKPLGLMEGQAGCPESHSDG
jgi:tetratricopeptide (TPR) repeat protein